MQGLIETYNELEEDQKSAESYRRYLEQFPADLQRRTDFIHLLLDMESYDEAIEQIQAAIPLAGEDLELKRLLAYCNRLTEQYVEAAVIYRNLLKDDPKNESYLRALCYCLDSSGNRKTAVELLGKAFDYITPSVDLRLIYGVLLYRQQQFDEALSQFRVALEDSPDDWRAYKNMGMIYKKRGITDFAEKYLARAAKFKPP